MLLDGFIFLYSLRWSPDSSRLLIAATRANDEEHIYIISRLGGSVHRLEYFPFVAWSSDGSRLAATWYPWKKIVFIDVSTGKVEADSLNLEFSFTYLNDLDWSPDGNRLLVHVILAEEGVQEIWTTRVNGSDPVRVARERELSSPRWSPSGESIYYVIPTGVIQALWKVGVDPGSGEVTNKPVIVLSGMTGLGPLAFTSDCKRLTYARHIDEKGLWLFQTDMNQEEAEPISRRLITGTALDDWPSVSPDGREIAFVRVTGEASNVFVVPIEGGPARQVIFMDSECFSPVWSPDGQEIAFVSYESGKDQVWKVSAKGGAATVFENTRIGQDHQLSWAPYESILYSPPDGHNIMILDPDSGDESPLLETEDIGWLSSPQGSPDGKSVAVAWNPRKKDMDGLWIISMVDSAQVLVLQGHWHPFGWSLDGRWIYSFNGPKVSRVRTDGSENEIILSLPFDDIDHLIGVSMSPDAKSILGGFKTKTPSDIWLVENFDPDTQ